MGTESFSVLYQGDSETIPRYSGKVELTIGAVSVQNPESKERSKERGKETTKEKIKTLMVKSIVKMGALRAIGSLPQNGIIGSF